MGIITKSSHELYGNMVEALNNFYWDNSILPEETAAKLDKFASEVSRLARYIRSGNPRLESDAELHVHPTDPAIELLRRVQILENDKYVSLPVDVWEEIDAVLKTAGGG